MFIIISILSLSFAIIWNIIFLPTSYYGFRIYKVDGIKMNNFLKLIKYSSILSNDEPEGWIYDYWFIGYIYIFYNERYKSKELWLLCTKNFYDNNFKHNNNNETNKINKITYWNREGSFFNITYSSRLLNLTKKEPTEIQKKSINKIIELYNKNDYIVSLLYGKSGNGKSMTAHFLCSELLNTTETINLCDTHVPFDSGDNFDNFYTKINPTKESPLVIVFEEIDIMIDKIHNNKIINGEYNPIQIKNKTDWNSFLDRFDKEMYPYTILIMTSNKDISWFNKLDKSYLREGRINLKIEF